ncbi:COG3014 family protein [Metapseudomonas furukawaii]|uniref:COG3014 family protein n=1 Tax=Metapseudomonas furukawaii TaxID=1149133 RepID=UPI004045C932
METRAWVALLACAALQLSGCSVFRSYESELTETSQQLGSGNPDAALALLEKNNQSEDKDLLYYLEKGELLRAKGDLSGSQAAWQAADRVVFEWEESVRADPEKYLGEFASYLVNDKVRRYEGYDYEKVMLTTQMALNDLALNDFDAARTEIKKTHEREALIADLRDKEYLKREEEAEKQGVTVAYKDLKGYPVASLDDPEVVALKNSYQSAFSHYLSGFVYEALGEKGLAAPGYRKAAELRPNLPLLEHALLDLDESGSRTEGESEVLLVVQSGLAPARDSMRIPLPLPLNSGLVVSTVSFPLLREDSSTPTIDSISLNGKSTALTEISSIETMSRRALRDDMPGIILRTSIRAVTRGVAQKQLNDNVSPLAGLAVGLMSIATEGADERTWRTLPDSIRIARVRLPKGEHQLALPTSVGGTQITLKVERDYQVVPLRVVGNQVFALGTNASVQRPVIQAVASNP